MRLPSPDIRLVLLVDFPHPENCPQSTLSYLSVKLTATGCLAGNLYVERTVSAFSLRGTHLLQWVFGSLRLLVTILVQLRVYLTDPYEYERFVSSS